MTEEERIKNALVNVITLAEHSCYYDKPRDEKDIDLIKTIVEKEIPKKPGPYSTCIKGFKKDTFECVYTTMYSGFVCSICGYVLTNDERKNHDNYCPNCGQRIGWSEE